MRLLVIRKHNMKANANNDIGHRSLISQNLRYRSNFVGGGNKTRIHILNCVQYSFR